MGYGTDICAELRTKRAGLGGEWCPGLPGVTPMRAGAQSPVDSGPAPLSADRALPSPSGDAVTSCLNPDPDSVPGPCMVSPLKMHVRA